MVRKVVFLAALLISLRGWGNRALAQTPLSTGFTYQGQLKDGGSPANGTYDLQFALYDQLTFGTQQGPTVCEDNVVVVEGLFTLELDFGAQFAGQERFLEIAVRADTGLNCGNATGLVTLSPRQALTGTPYAHFSLNADQLDGLDSADFLQSIPMPLTLSGTSPTHIIRGENASTGTASVGVYGLSTAASGETYGVRGRSDSAGGFGVFGDETATSGTTYGVYGRTASTTGRGVQGYANASSGSNYGVYGQSDSTSGTGVYGFASTLTGSTYGGRFMTMSSSGRAVYASALGGSGTTYGVYGLSESTSGRGVYGTAMAATGYAYGVYGVSASTSGVGTVGHASAGTGDTYGVYGQCDSADGTGVFGLATNTGLSENYGGHFVSNGQLGRAVYGLATNTSGLTYGGYFETDSNQGTGIWASGGTYGGRFEAASTSGVAVSGTATATSGSTYGVKGSAGASSSGIGVYGAGGAIGVQGWSNSEIGVLGQAGASGTGAIGGSFESLSPDGRGVTGWASGSGDSYGGYFGTPSTSGRGVYGQATAPSGSPFGGYFESASTSGYGVYARNSATSGTIYGVRGYASTAAGGYAVYAAGDMGASGTKPFRIDHPIDPENKYLLHYATESPEVLNFYSGKVTLDERGETVVELPDYFASINKDPRYMLTAIGAPMPMLHVAEEISEEALAAGEQAGPGDAPPPCTFRIAGGVAGGKVSWRVEALRNDLRVRLHGAPVEHEKTGPERGKYQHPEYYGLPLEKGMDHEALRARPPGELEGEEQD